ncbi:MAG: ABC transporter ATP-binding protein, partial [Gemmobacter sp.]
EFIRLKAMVAKTVVFITHDFDEALRLADRIAIMKDGAVEQCDTPDRIVMAPASAYVAKFTSAVDRSRVVHIGALAGPAEGSGAEGTALPATGTLREHARRIVADTRPRIPVADATGRVVGALDREKALGLLLGDAP